MQPKIDMTRRIRSKIGRTVLFAMFGVLSLVLLGLSLGTSSDEGLPVGADRYPGSPPSSPLSGQNLVRNGGFEHDFEDWTPIIDARLSTSIVHAGAKAFMATDSTASRFSYVYQELNLAYDSTEVSFWVYPASATYHQVFQLIANWQSGGSIDLITRVTLRDDLIELRAYGRADTISNVLIPNSWNKIAIVANRTTLTQDFSINGVHYGSLTSPSFPTIEHLLIGDLSAAGMFGTLYYDNIYVSGSSGPLAVDDGCIVDVEQNKNNCQTDQSVLLNDLGDNLTIKSYEQPQYGIASIHHDTGIATYWADQLPPTGFDIFAYTVTDGVLEATAVVWVIFDCGCTIENINCDDEVRGGKNQNDIDPDLLRRFRDEWLLPTTDGVRYVDYYYNLPEILRIFIFKRPDLRPQFVALAELLQPSIRNVLDGDGSLPITQAQMDSVAAFFTDLSSASSDSLQQLIADEMDRLGSLNDYVGLPVGEVLNTILGDPVGTAIENQAGSIPTDFVLEQNFPNPFNTSTEIHYTLSRPTHVTVAIYNLQGRKVATLIEGQQRQGVQAVSWDGLDDAGIAVSSGVYFVRLSTPTFQETKKVMVRR